MSVLCSNYRGRGTKRIICLDNSKTRYLLNGPLRGPVLEARSSNLALVLLALSLFAPYFPPDQPQKFANVHKIFGASNITKLLHDLPLSQREDAVNSLAYEADAR